MNKEVNLQLTSMREGSLIHQQSKDASCRRQGTRLSWPARQIFSNLSEEKCRKIRLSTVFTFQMRDTGRGL
jgi:hypothetical protein